jgi:hypothetical protein
MALITKLEQVNKERTSVHKQTDCTYTIFTENGIKYLQLDTFGSEDRQTPGKISQSIQFGPESISQLKEILKSL